MRLRNIFATLAAAVALCFVGCQEPERFLDEVRVSQSYISIPKAGGEVKITVTAEADWTLVAVDDKNKNMEMPTWFAVSAVSGGKGKSELVFSAGAATATNEQNLQLLCAGACQHLKVVQIDEKPEPELKTCGWINTNGEDGVTYRAEGTVTLVNSTYATYGGFTINDGTADLVVYGSDGNTAYPDLEVGDKVVVEGPWSKKYNNFGNGSTIVSREKSLIKVEKVFPVGELSKDGESFTVTLTSKGEDFAVVVDEEAQSWLTYAEPTVLGTTYIVEFTAAENPAGARSATVKFLTVSKGVDYLATIDVLQLGSITEATVEEFLAAQEGTAIYELTGKISKITSAYSEKYGNISFDLEDATGEVNIYRMSCDGVENPASLAVGDLVTVQGTRSSHEGKPQMAAGSVCVNHRGSTVVTVTEFLTKEKSDDVWYKLTGTIKEIVKAEYGNFYLEGESGEYVYVYGLTKAPVEKNDKSFESLGLNIGDKITIVGTKDYYAGASKEDQKDQVGGPAYFVEKHEDSTLE